jgi:hypothetical protein
MTDDFMQSPEFQALIKEYIAYLNTSLPAVRSSLKDGLYEEVYKFAHNIKGTGTSYGYSNLTMIGKDMCSQIHAKSFETLEDQLNKIDSILKEKTS